MAAIAMAAPAAMLERVEGRPAGGFIPIAVIQLVMAWWAYQTGAIRFRDLRAWFALWEIRERRCKLGPGGKRLYKASEILRLIGGVGEAGVRSALRRLERAGLVRFDSESIAFVDSPENLHVDDLPGLYSILARIENSQRRIPVPRRTILFLAGGARRVVIATVLGVLIRCVYAKRHTTVSGGRCKASWIASTFDVDLRRVKAARRHLEDIGWLTRFESTQWKENKWGRGVVVNLEWSRTAALEAAKREETESGVAPPEFSTTELPPRSASFDTELPPPCLNQTLPTELENQKPAPEAPEPGFSKTKAGPEKELPKPTLRHVLREDLRSGERLLVLFEEAKSRGLVKGSEHSRLQFFAAAEHAAVIGSVNPPGLFARLVHRGWWHYATQSDEDAANARIKKLLQGGDYDQRDRAIRFDDEPVLDAATALERLKRLEWGSLGE